MTMQPSAIFRSFDLLVKRFRFTVNAYSAFQNQKPINFVVTSPSRRQWPNSSLGPIDTINPAYPLPGSVGFPPALSDTKNHNKQLFTSATRTLPGTREDHYAAVLVDTYNATELDHTKHSLIPPRSADLECTIHTCPVLIKKDLANIFASRKFETSNLTALVLSHRTNEALDEWSELAATEREQLADKFIKSAIDICASLKELGYWADFIDPYKGTPYLGAHGDAKFLEADDKMRHFGFELDDMLCCKILRHPRWNHNVFAGLIFTDAPKDHPVLSHL